jgi:hypothetical protein
MSLAPNQGFILLEINMAFVQTLCSSSIFYTSLWAPLARGLPVSQPRFF